MSGRRRNEDDYEGNSIRSTVAKALTRHSKWSEKDDLLDVLYWGKQIISLIAGLLWGVLPLKGLFALALYILISTVIAHYYITWFQAQDDDLFGGFWEIAKEGFGAAFATFMISWIATYTVIHFD